MGINWDIEAPEEQAPPAEEAQAVIVIEPKPMASLMIALPEISLVKAQVEFARGQIDTLQKMVTALEVNTEEDEIKIVTLGGEAKKLHKLLEERKKKITESPRKFVSSVNNIVSSFTDTLEAIEAEAKKKQKDFRLKMKIETQQRLEAQKKAAEELQRKLDEEAAEATRKAQEEAQAEAEAKWAPPGTVVEVPDSPVFVAPKVPIPMMEEGKTKVRTDTGVTSYEVETWHWEITDEMAIERKYCAPVKKLLDQAVADGVRKAPGLRIWMTMEPRWRT